MQNWQLEIAERLARIEANQDYMKANISSLPQSPACEKQIKELRVELSELQTFKDAVNTKIAYIGGVIVLIGLFVPSAIKWIIDHLQIKL